MTITNIRTIHLIHRDVEGRKRHWSGGYFDSWSSVLIQVETEEGVTGLGEVYQGSCVSGAVEPFVSHFSQWLIGESALDPGRLWQKLYNLSSYWNRHGYAMGVLGAIDIALHDIAAKAAGVPLYEFLGGAAQDSLPMYYSAGCTRSIEEMIDEVREASSGGFRGYKWRVLDLGIAGEVMAALRKAAGDSFDIMVDAVQGGAPEPWSESQVAALCEVLAPYKPTWIEEPYRVEAIDSYVKLRRQNLVPVAGLEVVTSEAEAQSFFEAGALDVFQPDVTVAGGVTPVRRMIQNAAGHGVRTAMHSWGSGVSLMANLHVGLSTNGCFYSEYCKYANPLREGLLVEPIQIWNGRAMPPSAPGLGVELTPEMIERYSPKDQRHAGLVFELAAANPSANVR